MYSIFKDFNNDLYKIILLPILSLLFIYFGDKYLALVFLAILDSGHVYSTFSETFFDKNEFKKNYHLILKALFLNYFIFFISEELFFYYIFYYTVYHNMRQGLGISLMNKGLFSKKHYYILTCFPIFFGHFLDSKFDQIDNTFKLYKLDFLPNNFLYTMIAMYFMYIVYFLFKTVKLKDKRGLFFLFFGLVYSGSFIFINNGLIAYAIMITTHAIPYFFFMEKRTSKTHPNPLFKKYSFLIVLLFFIVGYGFDELIDTEIKYLIPLIFVSDISHYLLDAVMWTKKDKKFKDSFF